ERAGPRRWVAQGVSHGEGATVTGEREAPGRESPRTSGPEPTAARRLQDGDPALGLGKIGPTPGGEQLAIRADRQAVDHPAEITDGEALPPSGQVPDLHLGALPDPRVAPHGGSGPGGDPLAIGADRDAQDRALMPPEGEPIEVGQALDVVPF